MAQATINGFIFWKKPYTADDTGTKGFHFFSGDLTDIGYVLVAPFSINYDIPAGFDPVTGQIDLLEKKRQALTKEFHASITRIETEISKLLALPYQASGEASTVNEIFDDGIPF